MDGTFAVDEIPTPEAIMEAGFDDVISVVFYRPKHVEGTVRWLNQLIGRKPEADAHATNTQENQASPASTVRWLTEAENPWSVPVLDVHSYTQTAQAVSTVRQHAVNSVSFGGDDGTSFIGLDAPVRRTVSVGLRYRIDRVLADGSLFLPADMDQKWAIFFHRSKLIFVRSWTREVQTVAEVRTEGGEAVVTNLHGTFCETGEDPSFSVRVMDYLVRTHALGVEHPAPLPSGVENTADKAAAWCFTMFGNLAHFATPYDLTVPPPAVPLRTSSMLHIAAARGDTEQVTTLLDGGLPSDLIGRDGMTPLHWALIGGRTAVQVLLLSRGTPIDVRAIGGITPLMETVMRKRLDQAAFLLDHGADPNTRDDRGFTALHRAADTGQLDLVRLLLERGASPTIEARGKTARSLAEARGHTAVIEALSSP